MKLIGKLSKYDKIIAYMTNPDGELSELTEHEQQTLDRWQEAFTMLRNYKNTPDTVAILMKRFPGLSRATAFRDCRDAVSLFGDISKSTKEGIRFLSMEMIKDGAAIARAKNNEDGLIRAGVSLAKVGGVNVTDPDLPDFAKLETHKYVLGLPAQMVSMLQAMSKTGKIDLTQVVNNMSNFAQDAEEVKDDE